MGPSGGSYYRRLRRCRRNTHCAHGKEARRDQIGSSHGRAFLRSAHTWSGLSILPVLQLFSCHHGFGCQCCFLHSKVNLLVLNSEATNAATPQFASFVHCEFESFPRPLLPLRCTPYPSTVIFHARSSFLFHVALLSFCHVPLFRRQAPLSQC